MKAIKKIFNNVFPLKNFICATIYNFIFIRNDKVDKFTEDVERHEKVHCYQQVTLLITAIILNSAVSLFFGFYWWYFIIDLIFPFIIYILSWIIQIILPPYTTAYKDSCFEKEARALESDINYKLKLYPFSFIKYISIKDNINGTTNI